MDEYLKIFGEQLANSHAPAPTSIGNEASGMAEQRNNSHNTRLQSHNINILIAPREVEDISNFARREVEAELETLDTSIQSFCGYFRSRGLKSGEGKS